MAKINLKSEYAGERERPMGKFKLPDEYGMADALQAAVMAKMEADEEGENMMVENAFARANKSLIREMAEACEFEMLGKYIYDLMCDAEKPY